MYPEIACFLCLACAWCIWLLRGRGPRWSTVQRALVVVAHPDDESLFFANYINNAARAGVQVHILCLSTGNADGLGYKRVAELQRAGSTLQVHPGHIAVVDDPELQDGFRTWSAPAILRHLATALRSVQPDELVTFDSGGVSGHPNHTSIYHAVRQLTDARGAGRDAGGDAGSGRGKQCRVYTLVTHPLPLKFSGPLGVLLAVCLLAPGCRDLVLPARDPSLCFRAMCCHRSQFVWYRLLFVLFSTYTYANQLRPIGVLRLDSVSLQQQQQ